MVWYMGDWSGGEGQRNFDDQDPTQYSSAVQVNGRIPSQLQGPPARIYDSSSLTTADKSQWCFLNAATGTVWYAGSYRVGYVSNFSTSPWTWSVVNSTGVPATDYTGLQSLSTNYHITAATGDDTYFYYAAYNASSGKRVIMAKLQDTATNLATQLDTEGAATAPWAGLAKMGPRVYAWSGYSSVAST
jgi:hypothetical protein